MAGAHQTLRRSVDCRGVVLEWGADTRALVMGVLNVTPDSFSDGGLFTELDAAVDRVGRMLEEGADIIDIGGESTRPAGAAYGAGASAVPVEEELDRVIPVVEAVARYYPDAVISVDTYKSEVAEAAIEAGVHIVNDVTGFRADQGMPRIVAESNVGVVLMHSLGPPGEMPHEHRYHDVVTEVRDALSESIATARDHGIVDVIVDPGFGFGKSTSENLRLVGELSAFTELDRPILIGVSRKSSIGAVLGPKGEPRPVDQRLYGSLAAAAVAVMNGASIIRAHDVGPTRDAVEMLHAVRAARRRDMEVAG